MSQLRFLLIPLFLALLACAGNPQSSTPTLTPTLTPQPLASRPSSETETPKPEILPTATPPPIPSPQTHDPNSPDWTILVYMAADNSLEAEAMRDLNEMELAGISPRVNLIVQIDRAPSPNDNDNDWTTSRRYRITGDNDPNQLNAELLTDLGESNSGDPDTLADFISWGLQSYPANQYALFMWDHGSGWQGIATDNSLPAPDLLSLSELRLALDNGLRQTDAGKFDLIAFDACLMGQLELYQAIQPYADVAVASAELMPAQGWAYQPLLTHLYNQPNATATEFGVQLVQQFTDQYHNQQPNPFTSMAAVDLTAIPTVSTALTNLISHTGYQSNLTTNAVSIARIGAQHYARPYGQAVDDFSAVDLHHFATILAERIPTTDSQEAAKSLLQAIEAAVIRYENGSAIRHGNGIAIYFPRAGTSIHPTYQTETPLPAWYKFLTDYHAGIPNILPPALHLTNFWGDIASNQQPAYIELEIVGRDIENVWLMAGQTQADGRVRLLEYDYLIPEPSRLPNDELLYSWSDGVHEDFFIWQAESVYLTDGTTGDFTVLFPTSPGSQSYVAEGRYKSAGSEDYVEARLLFDSQTRVNRAVWGLDGAENGVPYEILPASGDEFQLYRHYTDMQSRQFSREQGITLTFSDSLPIAYQSTSVPDGAYTIGFWAEAVGGVSNVLTQTLTVQSAGNTPDQRTYLDPYQGFQFQYPADWYQPAYQDGVLFTGNRSQTSQLTLTQFPAPSWSDATTMTLKNHTLTQFGGVDLLYEDTTTVAGMPASRTAYHYIDERGERTGIFLTFIHDEIGYVLDLDGRAESEGETLALFSGLIHSWQFQPLGFGKSAGTWGQASLGQFTIAKPESFTQSEKAGWQIFHAPQAGTFLALRLADAGTPPTEILNKWVAVAGDGVTNFSADDPFLLTNAGKVWGRRNFSYSNATGQTIYGFVMISHDPHQPVVAWAEAPDTLFNQTEQTAFFPMLANLSP